MVGLSHTISCLLCLTHYIRGLDNAGKTTIVKKFNGEDIDTISPTLGFAIKTLEHRGYASCLHLHSMCVCASIIFSYCCYCS